MPCRGEHIQTISGKHRGPKPKGGYSPTLMQRKKSASLYGIRKITIKGIQSSRAKHKATAHNQAAQRAAFVVWLLCRPEYLLIRTDGNEVTSAAAVDMAGRTVATAESFANGMAKLEMHRCATGVYVAVVRLKSGKTVSRKFVHWQH